MARAGDAVEKVSRLDGMGRHLLGRSGKREPDGGQGARGEQGHGKEEKEPAHYWMGTYGLRLHLVQQSGLCGTLKPSEQIKYNVAQETGPSGLPLVARSRVLS